MKYCTRCVMPDTRPRLTFDENGVCSACRWSEEKRSEVPWQARREELQALCERHRRRNPSGFDVLVPVSGGKDGSYVSWKLKHEYGMHPLAVTVTPPLPFPLGNENLESFIRSGFDCVRVSPDLRVSGRIGRKGLVEQGQPLIAWIMNVQTVVFRIACLFRIPFVMFGEEGEVEYGGTTKLKDRACYDLEDSVRIYLSGNDPRRLVGEFTEKELYWWLYPPEEEFRALAPDIAHWSYFENWDPYEHYLLAKEKCGLREVESRCVGTYNNFSQTDTSLYDLHTWLMYLKFGFGRCTQDACIDIRRGAMTRRQALGLVQRFDGEPPDAYVEGYLDYFRMSRAEFDAAVDRHVNRALFEKADGRWRPTFVPR